MSKSTGGPAFPELGNVGYNSEWQLENGMTLRDYFAAKAMQGWLGSYGPEHSHPSASGSAEQLAVNSYAMADAMLKSRES